MARVNHQTVITPTLQVPGIWKDASSLVISSYLCAVIVLLFILTSSEDFFHWFIIPVTLSGILIGVDAVDWLRGRMDLMDPVGWVGLFGLHFFFLAPLLIVLWDYQMVYLSPMMDWRPWLGGMGILNTFGLIIYHVSRRWIKLWPVKPNRRIRTINSRILVIVLYFALSITLALQVIVYIQSGGFTGYIEEFETSRFTGSGALFAFSESFPFLLLIGIVTYVRSHGNRRSWMFILIILMIFFVVRLIFGGLRGSRSNTIFAMIWALGIIHLWLRPLPRRFLAASAIIGLLFLYVMGFYKALGSDFGRVIENPTQLSFFEKETNRTFQLALIGDLSRADTQAYIFHNLWRWPDFPYAWGRTYIGGYTIIIPSAIWPNKPDSKLREGTQAIHGVNSYRPGKLVSSRVYGLMGEAMLNFGILAALHPESAFRLWIPFLIILCVTYVVSDSDNNAVSLAMRALAPAIVLWLGSKPVLVNQDTLFQSTPQELME
jgi:hypothetical protein